MNEAVKLAARRSYLESAGRKGNISKATMRMWSVFASRTYAHFESICSQVLEIDLLVSCLKARRYGDPAHESSLQETVKLGDLQL